MHCCAVPAVPPPRGRTDDDAGLVDAGSQRELGRLASERVGIEIGIAEHDARPVAPREVMGRRELVDNGRAVQVHCGAWETAFIVEGGP